MIVALLGQHGSVGKTTPVPHFASQSSRQGKRIAVVDVAPDWSGQRARSPLRPLRRHHTADRRCITIADFPRSVSIPDMWLEPPARKFPRTNGAPL